MLTSLTSGMATDAAFAIRALRRHPGFSVLVFAVAALPIAVVTAVFTIFNGLYLAALPYPAPERLVSIHESMPSMADLKVSRRIRSAWAKSNRTFELISIYQEDGGSLAVPGQETVRLKGASVSWEMGRTLGITPILGQDFTSADDRPGAPYSILIGYDFWRTGLQASPAVIGMKLTLDNTSCTVIGVLPQAAVFPAYSQYWIPLFVSENDPSMAWDGVGRLKPGVTPVTARADLLHIDQTSPYARQKTAPIVEPLRERFHGNYRSVLRLLFAAAALVLLVACVNLAGLFFVRGGFRSREFAVRTAVGAGGYRIARQMLAEALLIVTLAGGAGAILGWLAVRVLAATAPNVLPPWVHFDADWRVLLTALTITSVVTFLSATGPAILTARLDPRSWLAAATPAIAVSGRLTSLLITGEVAFATVLMATASLVLDDAHRILNTKPGYRPEHTLTFGINPAYSDRARLEQFYERLFSDLRATSGIEAVGGATWLPPDDPFHSAGFFRPEGPDPRSPDASPLTPVRVVSPDYFRAMGIPLLEGREFTENELGLPPVVVSESLARRFWPGSTSVTGRRVVIPGPPERLLTVVGVARDVRQDSMDNAAKPFAYVGSGKIGTVWFYFVLRGPLDRVSLTAAARRAVHRIDPGLAIYDVQTLQERIDRGLGPRRAWTMLFGIFGTAGLILDAAGIYGVISYSVSRRTREIGIRMALGSRTDAIALSVLARCVLIAGGGAAIGLASSWAGSPLIAGLLAETSPRNLPARLIAGAVPDGGSPAGLPESRRPRRRCRPGGGVALRVDVNQYSIRQVRKSGCGTAGGHLPILLDARQTRQGYPIFAQLPWRRD